MVNIKKFQFNLFRENTMILWGESTDCVLLDPGFCQKSERDEFFDFIERKGLKPAAILLTHGHIDHIYGVAEAASSFSIPVYMSEEDRQELDFDMKSAEKLGMTVPDCSFSFHDIKDGDIIAAAGFNFKVIATPGHSMGSVCYLEERERIMFTGDTLFAGTIGRTDLLYSDYDKEIVSIMDKLMVLDGDIEIHPGHGAASDIAYERMNNPFLEPFNEPEEDIKI